ncbi:MAG: hypothetical protein AAGG69_12935 [Pseudomonadota bacterium]
MTSLSWRFRLICGVAGTLIAVTALAQDVPSPSDLIPIPSPLDNPNDPLTPPQLSPGPRGDDVSRNPGGLADVPPVVSYDLDALPQPVRRMRELIIEAAKAGDLERLRPLIGTGADTTRLSFGDIEGDPIEYLQSISGDSEGHEILAILQEVLEAGYVHVDAGTDTELYVWPYFFALPLDELTPVQRVELFKLVTAGDYEDMLSFGAYIFFRVGITPEGRWLFFVAGD